MSFDFETEVDKKERTKYVETIVDLATMMHNESITDSLEYVRNNCEKYYDCFLGKNIDHISFLYRDQLGLANTDEQGPCLLYGISMRPYKTIKVKEMQGVIDNKDKKYRDTRSAIIKNG